MSFFFIIIIVIIFFYGGNPSCYMTCKIPACPCHSANCVFVDCIFCLVGKAGEHVCNLTKERSFEKQVLLSFFLELWALF